MFRLCVSSILIIGLTVFAVADPRSIDLLTEKQRAVECYERGELSGAIAVLERILTHLPNDTDTLQNLMSVYRLRSLQLQNQGKYQQALRDADRFIELAQQYQLDRLPGQYQRVVILSEMGNIDAALEALAQMPTDVVLTTEAEDLVVARILRWVKNAVEQKDYSVALERIAKAAQVNQRRYSHLHLQTVQILIGTRQREHALAVLNPLARLLPTENDLFQYRIASAYLQLDHREEAKQHLKYISTDSPYWSKGKALLQSADSVSVTPAEMAEIPPKTTVAEVTTVTPPQPSLRKAESLIQQGDTDTALAELERFAADPSEPRNGRTAYELGYLYLQIGEKEKAHQYLQQVAKSSLFYQAAAALLTPQPIPVMEKPEPPMIGIDTSEPEVTVTYHGVEQHVRELSANHNIELILALALMKQESNMNPEVVSHAGAAGLCQIMPETGRELGLKIPKYRDIKKPTVDPTVDERFHPYKSMDAGFRYLRQLLNRYDGNVPLALSAYNAGMGRTRRKVARIRETVTYVADVMTHYWHYQDEAEMRQAMARLVRNIEAFTE